MASVEILTESGVELFSESGLALLTEFGAVVLRTDSRTAAIRTGRTDTAYVLTEKGEVQTIPMEDSN